MRVMLALLWSIPLLWLCSINRAAEPVQPAPLTHTYGPTKGWPHTVRGLGLTSEDARDNAFDQARKTISLWLGKQQPPMRYWQPPRTYIEQYLVDDEKPGTDIKLEDVGQVKSWIILLHDPDVDDMRRRDRDAYTARCEMLRKERAYARGAAFGKLMLGVLVGLVVVFAGARLLEKNRLRYTHLALAGMIAVVAFIVLGLYIL